MPPIAPAIGRATWAGRDSSPSITSRLISKPTSRKNTAISPSLIHSSRGLLRPAVPKAMVRSVSSSRCGADSQGELANRSANRVAASIGSTLPASLFNNVVSRFIRVASPSHFPGALHSKTPEFCDPGVLSKTGWLQLIAALSHEAHEELEQVDEVEIEAEGAEDGDLLGRARLPSLGILFLDLLRV